MGALTLIPQALDDFLGYFSPAAAGRQKDTANSHREGTRQLGPRPLGEQRGSQMQPPRRVIMRSAGQPVGNTARLVRPFLPDLDLYSDRYASSPAYSGA